MMEYSVMEILRKTALKVCAAALLLPLWCVAPELDDYFPPPDSAGGWRTLKNAEEIRKVTGMDLAKLDSAFEYASRTSQHGGLLVVRHGYLIYEKYYGKGSRAATPVTASCAEVFTSVACGIMLNDYKSKIPNGLDT